MGLRIFNTMGRELQDFEPLQGKKVGIYGCGPTVYTYAHIGNLRAYVFQDTLVRTLRWLGYDVTHVMNITDVGHLSGDDDTGEDKMVKSAQERGKSVLEIAEFYTKAFFNDTERLNIKRPTVVCKATEHIADMIELIERIEKNGYTYFAGGNLYFDVTRFPNYGKLARIKLEDLQAGARVDIDENKHNPHDFVLWFTRSKFENQALVWDSPWGRGYPGWHIECSAMSMKYLGEQFEIHTGGIDHIPIHHTNEIAQSESATGKQWVKYWMHNEFLILDKEKMSKSSGKFLTLETLVEAGYEPLDYRYFLLSGHYRSQLQFNYDALNTSRASRKSLMEKIWSLREKVEPKALSAVNTPGAASHINAFRTAIEDDLNTPRALAEVYMVLKDTSLSAEEMLSLIAEFDKVLGLRLLEDEKKQDALPADVIAKVERLIQERTDAKKNKDWARADAIRAELLAMNIVLEDSKEGTKWKRQ